MNEKTIKELQHRVTGKRDLYSHEGVMTYVIPDKLYQLKPGYTLPNNYVIVELKLFGGGESVHYLCTKNDKDYIMKIYADIKLDQASVYALLTSTRSPHLLLPIETGRLLDGHFYEILPFITKGTVEDSLKFYQGEQIGRIEQDIIPSINEAIHALHQVGIIHNDIKPSNMYLNADNHVLLGDFGQAESFKLTDKKGRKIQGKFRRLEQSSFLAPEVVFNTQTPPLISTQSDYYSFGTSLIDLYTKGEWSQGKIQKRTLRHGEEVIILPDTIPQRSKDLIYMLTQKEKHLRPTYEEVSQWLKQPKKFEYSYQSALEKHEIPISRFTFENVEYTDLHDLLNEMVSTKKNITNYVENHKFKSLFSTLTPDKHNLVDKVFGCEKIDSQSLVNGLIRIIQPRTTLYTLNQTFSSFDSFIAFAYQHYSSLKPSHADIFLIHQYLKLYSDVHSVSAYIDTIFLFNDPLTQFDLIINMFKVQSHFFWDGGTYLSLMDFLKSLYDNRFVVKPLIKEKEDALYQCLMNRQDNDEELYRIQQIKDLDRRYFSLVHSVGKMFNEKFSFIMNNQDHVTMSLSFQTMIEWFGTYLLDNKKGQFMSDKIIEFMYSPSFITYIEIFNLADIKVLQSILKHCQLSKNQEYAKAVLWFAFNHDKSLNHKGHLIATPDEAQDYLFELVNKKLWKDYQSFINDQAVKAFFFTHGITLPKGAF
jgi:serine/threonine protein kinase